MAADCQVSVNTVSDILNRGRSHLYRAETIAGVTAAARRLGYRPNRSAQAMRSRRSGVVAMVSSVTSAARDYIWHHHLHSFIVGLSQGLLASRRHLILLELDELASSPDPLAEVFVDGLVVCHQGFARAQELGLPVVWFDADDRAEEGHVHRDERAAGALVARELLARNHRRTVLAIRHDQAGALAAGLPMHFSLPARVEGFTAAMRAAGAEVTRCDSVSPGAVADCLRRSRATAVATDLTDQFPNLLQAAALAGLDVPGRLSLASFDVDGRRYYPDLAFGGAVYDRYAAGQAVAERMDALLAEPPRPAPALALAPVFQAGTTVAEAAS